MAGQILEKTLCFHCGDECEDLNITIDDKSFCCSGCKTVYEILKDNNLCTYYSLDAKAGNHIEDTTKKHYEYLNDPKISQEVLSFKEGDLSAITFYIPSIHCSSCIWLLENMHKINGDILSSTIDFPKKQLSIQFKDPLKLGDLALLLHRIGYPPLLNNEIDKQKNKFNKSLLYKIGIAGFCFGNIMLLSLPEYFNTFNNFAQEFKTFFSVLNLILSLPVFFYCASEYWIQSWNAIKTKVINIDLPIAAALLAAFGQSVYEITTGTGAGFMDSFTGLVFFLLIGKWYQSKTYDSLSFDRDYKSYFPLAVARLKNEKEEYVRIKDLTPGDEIIIRNGEIIPADGILVGGRGKIDYSFVTGESTCVEKHAGEMIYAGGKQTGAAIYIKTTREVSESYLTQLWEKNHYQKSTSGGLTSFTNVVGKYFTYAILVVSVLTFIYWKIENPAIALFSAICVLIVFCPCTLSISLPFCFGNAMGILGKTGMYLKNTATIERLGKVDTIVFDKTGTISHGGAGEIELIGPLSAEEKMAIALVAKNSIHPLSKLITEYLGANEKVKAINFSETVSGGITGDSMGMNIRLGSAHYVNPELKNVTDLNTTKVFVAVNNLPKAVFKIKNKYREGIKETFSKLSKKYELHLLSGDNDSERKELEKYFPKENLHFHQSPVNKLDYIKNLQSKNKNVLMVGDGLNDAGALMQSDTGISVSDDGGSFSPACDAILDGKELVKIPDLLTFCSKCVHVVKLSLVVSLLYNMTGLTFATQGLLTPLIAAILMPVSSVSVVLFVTMGSKYFAKKLNLKTD